MRTIGSAACIRITRTTLSVRRKRGAVSVNEVIPVRSGSPLNHENPAGRGPQGLLSRCSSARSLLGESLAAIHAIDISHTAHSRMFLQGALSCEDPLVHDHAAIWTEAYRHYRASVIVVGATLPLHSLRSLCVLLIRSGRNRWPFATSSLPTHKRDPGPGQARPKRLKGWGRQTDSNHQPANCESRWAVPSAIRAACSALAPHGAGHPGG